MTSRTFRRIKGFILVLIQFICLGGIIYTGSLVLDKLYSLFLEIFSFCLALWAIIVMQQSKLNVFPEVRKGAIIIMKGPYRLIRHPMYVSLILFTIAQVLDKTTYLRVIILIVLILDLIIKIEFEEIMLVDMFPEYKIYADRTKKLLPFIY
jgi:protein-S-isoprenylcysteine O-methyltransferase Ste14